MSVSARAWLEIDLAALRDNARAVSAHAGTRLAPVLKADAYGLGAVPVAQALEPLDLWGYCVATPAEGTALRDAGILRPILCCPPMDPAEASDVVRAHLLTAIQRVGRGRGSVGGAAPDGTDAADSDCGVHHLVEHVSRVIHCKHGAYHGA